MLKNITLSKIIFTTVVLIVVLTSGQYISENYLSTLSLSTRTFIQILGEMVAYLVIVNYSSNNE